MIRSLTGLATSNAFKTTWERVAKQAGASTTGSIR